MKYTIAFLWIGIHLIACEDSGMDPIPRDPETPTYETLRVGAVTPLNGYFATGNVQIIDSVGSL